MMLTMRYGHICMLFFAWVLWTEESRFWNPKAEGWGSQTSDWEVVDGSSSETECRRKLADTMKRAANPDIPPNDDLMLKKTEDTITYLFFPKNTKETDKVRRSQVFRYVCLPDSVNPRPLKSEK
jgi:hypothetical protein